MADDASSWEKERLTALLDAAKTAISRSRYVFAAVNVATIVMLSAEYNGSIPWLRNIQCGILSPRGIGNTMSGMTADGHSRCE
jgi:hypothetical protein